MNRIKVNYPKFREVVHMMMICNFFIFCKAICVYMRGFKFTGVKLICLYLLCFVVFKNRADAITHLCVKIYIHFLNRCAGKDFLLCTPASIIVEMWYLK